MNQRHYNHYEASGKINGINPLYKNAGFRYRRNNTRWFRIDFVKIKQFAETPISSRVKTVFSPEKLEKL
jgi:hypothetical protein